MDKIRIGIIGAGNMAGKHLGVIAAIDNIEAVGITSRTKSKAQQLANEYDIKVCADNLEELINKSKPDALMVLVSEDQTYGVTVSAISYQLPLFVEKPAGLVPQENYQLAELARKHSVDSMVGFNRRFYSNFHKGFELIKEHGPLLGVRVEGHERFWRIREAAKFSQQAMENWIFANSTHTIDLLRFFGGEVTNLQSIAHSYVEERGDQFAAVMELDSGAIGQYSAHWYSPGGWSVTLYGQGITVEFKPLEAGRWIDKKFDVHEIIPDKVDLEFKAGFYNQMKAFADLVRCRKLAWPALDLEGSCKTMSLAEELSVNLQKKTW